MGILHHAISTNPLIKTKIHVFVKRWHLKIRIWLRTSLSNHEFPVLASFDSRFVLQSSIDIFIIPLASFTLSISILSFISKPSLLLHYEAAEGRKAVDNRRMAVQRCSCRWNNCNPNTLTRRMRKGKLEWRRKKWKWDEKIGFKQEEHSTRCAMDGGKRKWVEIH